MSSISTQPRLLSSIESASRPTSQWMANAGVHISRYSLVLMLFWFGLQKFTAAEAAGIQLFVSHSPFMNWMYSLWSMQTVSGIIGVWEIAAAVLIACRPFCAKASFLGSVLATVTFLATVSFLFTTPGVLGQTHPIPFLGELGGFLVKDLSLLGGAVWTAAEAWGSAQAA